MNEIHEGSGELDKYLYSLIEMLRTKYYNVSVNRGSVNVTFFYCEDSFFEVLKHKLYGICPKKRELTIPNTEILGYYMTNEIPPQILNLLK